MSMSRRPFMMGILMGPMVLWMAHGAMTSNNGLSGSALAAFIGAHVLIGLVIIGGGVFAARLSPQARDLIDRLHRPSIKHVMWMLVGAAAAATAVHLSLHGIA